MFVGFGVLKIKFHELRQLTIYNTAKDNYYINSNQINMKS